VKFREKNISTYKELVSLKKSYNIEVRQEEYGRVYKPWARKWRGIGTSRIVERLLMKGQSLFYLAVEFFRH